MKRRLQSLAFLVALAMTDGVPAQVNSFARSTEEAEPVKTDAANFEQRTSTGKEPPPPSREDKDGGPGHQVKPVFFDKSPKTLAPVAPGGPGCCQSGACKC
jgi:hypothetical protein